MHILSSGAIAGDVSVTIFHSFTAAILLPLLWALPLSIFIVCIEIVIKECGSTLCGDTLEI